MQFHLRTLVDYVAIALYLLAVLAVIGAPVKLLLRWTGASVGRVVPAPVIGIALVVIAQWYWATPFGATKPVARLLLLVCGLVGLGAAVVILRRRSWRTIVGEAELRALAGIAAACFVGIGLILVVSDA